MNNYCIAEGVSLQQYNSMRLNPSVKRLILPYNPQGIEDIFREYTRKNEPILLGEGSNTIFSCEEYEEIICFSLMKKIYIQNGTIHAECGVTLHDLAWFALENGIGGYEYLEDIPGSVGGALCMNAGTYEDYIANNVISVTIYDFHLQSTRILTADDLSAFWGKRMSYFQTHKCCIISCELDISQKNNEESIFEKIYEIKKKRHQKQPRSYPSAGSVFKRPYLNGEPKYVWTLLTEAGLKGYSIGSAQISEKHPGFIINTGGATGQDVVDLMNYCKKTVYEKTGILLEEEWRIV